MTIAAELGRRAGMHKRANLPQPAPGPTEFGSSAPQQPAPGPSPGGLLSPTTLKGILPALGPVLKPVLGATGGPGLLGLTDALHGFKNIGALTQGSIPGTPQ
jgi:hypothetical protein